MGIGLSGRKQPLKEEWRKAVHEVIELLSAALEPQYVVLGGLRLWRPPSVLS
jgi:hypothetical protein